VDSAVVSVDSAVEDSEVEDSVVGFEDVDSDVDEEEELSSGGVGGVGGVGVSAVPIEKSRASARAERKYLINPSAVSLVSSAGEP
jgi:hypothetical protein